MYEAPLWYLNRCPMSTCIAQSIFILYAISANKALQLIDFLGFNESLFTLRLVSSQSTDMIIRVVKMLLELTFYVSS